MSHDAIFFANGLGDALMALPGIRAALHAMPEATLITPHHPAYDFIFSEFERRISIPPRSGLEFDWRDLDRRAGEPDRLAVFTSWSSDALKDWVTVVNGRGFTSGLIGEVSRIAIGEGHYVRRYFEVARNIDPALSLEDHTLPLLTLSTELDPGGQCYYVLHLDSADEKMLADAVWEELVSSLARRRPDLQPVVVGRDLTCRRRLGGTGKSIAHAPFDFAASCEILAGATFFAGVDSSFLHFADLQRIPAVGVFRTPNDDRFGLHLTPNRVNLRVGPDAESQGSALLTACLTVAGPPKPLP